MDDQIVNEDVEGDLDGRIAEVALRKIAEAVPSHDGMLLSVLGNRISDELGPLRQHLRSRTTLRRILETKVGGKVSFTGLGNRVSVRLVSAPSGEGSHGRPATRRTRRYDKIFWTAFAKPVRAGCRRSLKPSRPYDFQDGPEEFSVIQAEWVEVEASLVPPPDMPRTEREANIHASIEAWCTRHGFEPERFVDLNPEPSVTTLRGETVSPASASQPSREFPPGVDALRRLVEAVPEADRSKFNLPLDLIHALLSRV